MTAPGKDEAARDLCPLCGARNGDECATSSGRDHKQRRDRNRVWGEGYRAGLASGVVVPAAEPKPADHQGDAVAPRPDALGAQAPTGDGGSVERDGGRTPSAARPLAEPGGLTEAERAGYAISVCACDEGPYLCARKAGTPCCCERCGFITAEQLAAVLAARAQAREAEWKPRNGTIEDDLRSRLLCIEEATYWDQGYDVRLSAIRGMCDLTSDGMTPAPARDGLAKRVRALESIARQAISAVGFGGHSHWRSGGSGGTCQTCVDAAVEADRLRALLDALLAEDAATEGGEQP